MAVPQHNLLEGNIQPPDQNTSISFAFQLVVAARCSPNQIIQINTTIMSQKGASMSKWKMHLPCMHKRTASICSLT